MAPDAEPPAAPARPGPSPFMRFIVVVFGVMFLGLGQALVVAGGPVGWAVGVVTYVLGVAVIGLAIGLVEWIVRRRSRAARPDP